MNLQIYLDQLLGTWMGFGEGIFPGIEDFRYRETLQFEKVAGRDALLYQQNAILIDSKGHEIKPSHLECGILQLEDDGTLSLHNAQNGRVEIMHGKIEAQSSKWHLRLESTDFAGDDRMQGSSRIWRINQNQLTYEMDMRTTKTKAAEPHLKATLTRKI